MTFESATQKCIRDHPYLTSEKVKKMFSFEDVQHCIYADFRLVHVVRDFRSWDVMTKVSYFLCFIFNFRTLETPIESKFRYIKVFGKSPDHVQPL